MPNKAVPGWTQVPVAAGDLLEINYSRTASGSAACSVTAKYEIKDTLGAVRAIATYSAQAVTYPISLATILSTLNTAQGT